MTSSPRIAPVRKAVVPAARLDYAVIGRYVLDPSVFDILERTAPGRGGEIQLTDALQELPEGGEMYGVVFKGLRYDTGDRADYLRTVVRPACGREDLGPGFRAWLKEFVVTLDEGTPPGERTTLDGRTTRAGGRRLAA